MFVELDKNNGENENNKSHYTNSIGNMSSQCVSRQQLRPLLSIVYNFPCTKYKTSLKLQENVHVRTL